MKRCIKCQAELDNEEIFCSECGTKQHEKLDEVSSDLKDTAKISSDLEEILEVFPESSDDEEKSDCQHFKIEWNRGSSTFLANTISNLQFRITPKTSEVSKAEKFIIYLKFPEDVKWRKKDLRIKSLSFARTVSINYKPKNDVSGDCSVDFHFLYWIGKTIYCFEQQIQLHIHDNTNKFSSEIHGGLNINIGDVHQEGKAGDPNLNLPLGELYKEEKSSYEKLSKLHRSTSWETLQLFQAVPLYTEAAVVQKMIIPLPPSGKYEKVSIQLCNKNILLYKGEITVGRSRDADYLTRNDPIEGDSWELDKLQTMNLSISKIHCKIGIIENKAFVLDNDTVNGTFINGIKLEKGKKVVLDYHTNYEISLASPNIYPKNIQLEVKVYPSTHKVLEPDNEKESVPAGIVIKQIKKDNVSAVIINRWVPLSAIIPDASNLFLTYKNNHYAITDGVIWNWLVPGLVIELDKDIIVKIDKL
ncbi:MAG TPA: FHA domain-containing protein [Victivallales bacterium]|nr:FHA domain-containing protein [Victivallales bacterium]